jgi:antitoxin component YwqK of YwqJK toxin-antitoxin module
MMLKSLILLLGLFGFIGCLEKKKCPEISYDKSFLDSIIKNCDTSYTKAYKPNEFAIAEYFISRRDSTVCQLMKAQDSTIRQIIIARNNIRIYFAECFPQGQLKAKLLFNRQGNYEGEGIYYYENGCVRYSGNFHNGLYTGEWKNFDSNGKLTSIDKYNESGQLQSSVSVQ